MISAMEKDFVVEVAENAETMREAQQLRYQVFSIERKIFSDRSPTLIETDDFDANSRHVVIRRRSCGEIVGTVRLVLASSANQANCLPMQRYCSPAVFRDLPMHSTAEISRFALSKHRRSTGCTSDASLRLGLMQGILRVSSELQLTHWCAIMERSLLRLMQTAGVHFVSVGPMVEAYGLRQPSIAEISTLLTRGKHQCPELYKFVKAGIQDH